MVVLIDGVRYWLATPEKESVLEKRVEGNHRHIFGEHSFYFSKKKIKSKAGIGTIPDAFVIYFDPKPNWAIIEVELASHSVYNHVFPQLTKFKRALEDGVSRRKIADFFYETVKADTILEAKMKKQIGTGEVYKFISDLVAEQPMIAVIIDEKTKQLEEALLDFGRDVKVVEFKTYQREGVSDDINAYCFEPIVKHSQKNTSKADVPHLPAVSSNTKKTRPGIGTAIYALFDDKGVDSVSYGECEAVAKSVKPDTAFNKRHFSWYKNHYRKKGNSEQSRLRSKNNSGILPEGLKLFSHYKGRKFSAKVIQDGKIKFDGQIFNSPSLAAIAAIQSTGSERETENGWNWWKFKDSESGEDRPIDILRR